MKNIKHRRNGKGAGARTGGRGVVDALVGDDVPVIVRPPGGSSRSEDSGGGGDACFKQAGAERLDRWRDESITHRAAQQDDTRHEGPEIVHVAGEAVALSLYPRLVSILASIDDLDPQLRSIGWIVRLIDELYEARRRAEQASFAAEEDHFNLDSGTRKHASFPAFAYKHLKNRHGIKHVVRSVCLDLVCNAHIYRRHHPEVEVFARFLEEFYGQKELCFFLDVREEAHRVTRAGARRSKVVTQAVWMSLADCVRVAKGVFLDAATLYFRDLISTVEGQMTNTPSGGGTRKMDRRLISLSDFLYLAIVCFVSPKEPEEDLDRRGLLESGSLGPRAHRNGGGGGNGRDSTVGISRNAAAPLGLSSVTSGDGRFFSGSLGGSSSGEIAAEVPVGGPLDDGEPCTSGVVPRRRTVRQDDAFGAVVGGFKARASFGEESCGGGVSSPSDVGAGDTRKRGDGHDSSVNGARRVAAGESECGRGRWLSEGNIDREVGGSDFAGMDVLPSTPDTILPQRQRPKIEPEAPVLLSPLKAPALWHTAAAEESQKEIAIAEGTHRRSTHFSPECKGDPPPWGQSLSASESPVAAAGIYGSRGDGRIVGDEDTLTSSTRAAQATTIVAYPPSPPPYPEEEDLRNGGTRSALGVVELLEEVAREGAREGGAVRSSPPSDVLENLRWGMFGRVEGMEYNEKEEEESDEKRPWWCSGSAGLHTQDALSALSPASDAASAVQGSRGVRREHGMLTGEDKYLNLLSSAAGDDGRGEGEAVRAPRKATAEGGRVSSEPGDWMYAGDDDRSNSESYASAEDGADWGDGPFGTGATVGDGSTVVFGTAAGGQQTAGTMTTTTAIPPPVESPRLDRVHQPHHYSRPSPSLVERVETKNRQEEEKKQSLSCGGFPSESGGQRENSQQIGPEELGRRNDTRGARGSAHVLMGVASRHREPTRSKDGEKNDGDVVKDDSGNDSDGLEIRADVLSIATDWFASFERRFMPCLAATSTGAAAAAAASTAKAARGGSRYGGRPLDGFLPQAIARVLSEEMVRVLAVRRRDLHAVARSSPELLRDAVAKAFWMLESAVSTRATHSRALSNMGKLLEDRGYANEALLCFEEAWTVDASSAEALCRRAESLQRREELQGAALYFEEAISRDDSYWSAWHGLGQVKAAQGKFADAVEAFSRWIEGEHRDRIRGGGGDGGGGGESSQAKGLVQLGDAQRGLGQDEHAQRSYERAISLDERCSDAHFKLGSLLQPLTTLFFSLRYATRTACLTRSTTGAGGHEAEALEAFGRAVKAAGAAAPSPTVAASPPLGGGGTETAFAFLAEVEAGGR